ncbi:MAG TPA: ATP phosphoribosyltransferase regulatory subunit [Gammaproteobacteria bacterium]|nr:ATP phosphoribosyltransferase regulatory subunit [Gammaproteobacteria bacterium]
MTRSHWQLPEGVEVALPEAAARLELARRRLLDLFSGWGYRLVMPPIVDQLESLLTGVGNDLERNTFKLVDPLTGHLLGVRADMTPQVARMDAHQLAVEGPSRLCYLGSVLTVHRDGLCGSRNPLQVGAELYGSADVAADLEVLSLMVAALDAAGVTQPCVDLGHMGIFHSLVEALGLDSGTAAEVFGDLQRKALPALLARADGWSQPARARRWLTDWVRLSGDASVLVEARSRFADAGSGVLLALDTLAALVAGLRARCPKVEIHIDLADLRGYHYHTGVIFSAYARGYGQSLARGGRYDDIGRFFGRARPATGFSLDLKAIADGFVLPVPRPAILAPAGEDPALEALVAALRAAGETVIRQLPGPSGDCPERYARSIVRTGQGWAVQEGAEDVQPV